MKAILFGVFLGVLLAWPAALSLTAAIVTAVAAAILSKPVVVAFGLGLAAGARLRHHGWRWAR
ncbi:hypothetical protein ACIQSP_19930 [Streptomyces nigra]|uniref:hypothetical protein n=1 Tax=Streptomyces nigra TaxID=1827580 RepID=UPI00382BCFFA